MRPFTRLGTVCALLLVSGLLQLHAQNPAGDLQGKLNSAFTLTKITADRSDIVTAGSVLVLHRDGLLMYTTDAPSPPLNNYKDGRLQQSATGNYFRGFGVSLLHGSNGQDLANIPKRSFVSGEKFWLTGTNILPDGVVLNVYSDPYNNVRYYGQIKFPFAKGAMPPAEALMSMIAEVVTVDNSSQGGDNNPAPAQAPAPPGVLSAPSSAAAMAPIAPPPPPTDQPPPQPKTIALGQSKDVVIDTLGPPQKDIKLSTKEILFYSDMKITLVNGKVSDVE